MQSADSARVCLPRVGGRQGEAAAERAVVNDSPVGCQSREWPSRSEKGHGLPWRRGCWELKCLLPSLDELCAARCQNAPSAIARDLEKWFDCSFFYAFFLPEKESVGKKSRHKGDCAAIRFAPIRRSFPLIYPPMTAQPIATWQTIVRNARQVLCLAFLIRRMHV